LSIRIILADDHPLFRQGLCALLQMQAGMSVVGQVDQLSDLDLAVATTPADVLLLDLHMERNALEEISRLSEQLKVIVVTASERVEEAVAAMRAGARAVIVKRSAVDHLIDAITTVANGQVWMPAHLEMRLASDLHDGARERLTPRELDIVRHVALGLRNAEVAKKLFISEDTVKTHLHNVFSKLGVRERVELTFYALRAGIVSLSDRRG
jgi:DNA-binding NarL/FixJ family response regulator